MPAKCIFICKKETFQCPSCRSECNEEGDYEAPGIPLDTNPAYNAVNTYDTIGEKSI